ncbi:MAG: DUF72 domain-containing protein [Gammaproteobacteria bacterium]
MNSTCAPQGILRIGCAGWTIPKISSAAFPAEGSHLERYARVLNAVEINSSFYRPHQVSTYARWAASVPDDFRFSVKLPKTITHEARLADIDAPLAQFAGEVAALGEKLGCILIQLPPKLALEVAVADAFFEKMRAALPVQLVCEARNASWFGEEGTELLRRHGVTRVIADPAKGQPGEHVPTTQTIYARLHGSPRIYYSPYETAYLEQLGRDMATHAHAGRDVWVIFDNTLSPTFMDEVLTARRAAGMAGPPAASTG